MKSIITAPNYFDAGVAAVQLTAIFGNSKMFIPGSNALPSCGSLERNIIAAKHISWPLDCFGKLKTKAYKYLDTYLEKIEAVIMPQQAIP